MAVDPYPATAGLRQGPNLEQGPGLAQPGEGQLIY